MSDEGKIKKVSIIISQGSLEGAYPGLIMANGARMMGIEVNVFFTFFGLNTITKSKMNNIKVATVGNPAMGIPSLIGILPGMSSMATNMMKKQMEELDIPPIGEFIEMISDAGGKIYACLATVEMFKLKKEDFCDQLDSILTVGDFYNLAAGGQIIFT
ncbi:DsrE/DsrF/DrsH-like family protein [Desulfitobacterium sp. THU1]|uniref:DsrE/DsrF/DrsH-like family protein n=1 Tax=Desulfitobacterium sp. THU1 TaxID=3138072 RepID=UPI00311D39E7